MTNSNDKKLEDTLLALCGLRSERKARAQELEEAKEHTIDTLGMPDIGLSESAYDRKPLQLPKKVVRERRKRKIMEKLRILFGIQEPEELPY